MAIQVGVLQIAAIYKKEKRIPRARLLYQLRQNGVEKVKSEYALIATPKDYRHQSIRLQGSVQTLRARMGEKHFHHRSAVLPERHLLLFRERKKANRKMMSVQFQTSQ